MSIRLRLWAIREARSRGVSSSSSYLRIVGPTARSVIDWAQLSICGLIGWYRVSKVEVLPCAPVHTSLLTSLFGDVSGCHASSFLHGLL
jgi:hypothetical protein